MILNQKIEKLGDTADKAYRRLKKKMKTPANRLAATLTSLGDQARDSGKFLAAADLYRQAIEAGTPPVGLLLICGHMYKEGRDFPSAERYYKKALAVSPMDKEVFLQLGHFNKSIGRYGEAEKYYQEAIIVDPDWEVPRQEIENLRRSSEYRRLYRKGSQGDGRLSGDLVAKTRDELYIDHGPAFVFTHNGNGQATRWGSGITIRGIEALRGYVVSDQIYTSIEISLDGTLIYAGDLTPAPLRREKSNAAMRKYVYNAWIDFSDIPYGSHDLLFVAKGPNVEPREGVNWRREHVIFAEPFPEDVVIESPAYVPRAQVEAILAQMPLSEATSIEAENLVPTSAVVTSSLQMAPEPTDPWKAVSDAYFPQEVVARVRNVSRCLQDAINALPTVVMTPKPDTLPGKVRNVAVIRGDQLGDLSVSVGALMRLRQALPNARIVGLLSPANVDLAKTLGVFDEYVILDYPDDALQRDRVMNRTGQLDLIKKLKAYDFDVAIDFSIAGGTRKLLPMTGAPITIGFGSGNEGFRSLNLNVVAMDPRGGGRGMRHSANVHLLAESIALWLNGAGQIVKRNDLTREDIAKFGLAPTEDYIVIHSGSRLPMVRWLQYPALCERFLAQGWKVVYFSDDESEIERLPQDKIDDGSIIYMSRKISFKEFDALLTYCSLFVGNDSGPKHLASLRGAKVLSIQPGRSDWREWGQELTGNILIRRVPCAGCALHYDPEECAHDVACVTKITLDEVFREAKKLLEIV
ncbi:glycosyltransferase family 9 protein [Gluconobacter cerinus]|uniref:glycosyltransferase family 9 protein n=1 Tax=Gluconobacter cerinus TaxID=38307 RepID=UPI001B8B9527|nr:glycosyltransferase family 9 protein [Gluconobacter cerinus]MBS1026463.1 hypothetical protein [Gluconobacter cerinus]